MGATWAGTGDPVAAAALDAWLGEVFDTSNSLGDIKNILSGTSHRLPSRHKCHLEFILCIRQQDDLHS